MAIWNIYIWTRDSVTFFFEERISVSFADSPNQNPYPGSLRNPNPDRGVGKLGFNPDPDQEFLWQEFEIWAVQREILSSLLFWEPFWEAWIPFGSKSTDPTESGSGTPEKLSILGPVRKCYHSWTALNQPVQDFFNQKRMETPQGASLNVPHKWCCPLHCKDDSWKTSTWSQTWSPPQTWKMEIFDLRKAFQQGCGSGSICFLTSWIRIR